MRPELRPYFLIAAAALLIYLPFLGAVHLLDWDEINFAESAREMLVTGNYFQVQVNYMPFWEKPPLFIWMQAFSMKLFGVNEFAARFPNALCGAITLVTIYHLGKQFFSRRLALYWVLAYAGSLTPQLYFRSGIIDPFFNLFIFLGIVFLSLAAVREKKERKLPYFLAGAFIGLALITKGPVALMITLLCLFMVWVFRSFVPFFDWKDILLFAGGTLLLSFAWYGVEFINHGFWFFQEFLRYQSELASQPVATHGQPWYYHVVVLLVGCFPASLIAIRAFGENLTWTLEEKNFRNCMAVLFWVVLIVFSLVTTKIIHYSSLCYLPLTFLAGMVMANCHNQRIQYRRTSAVMVFTLGTFIAMVFLAIPLLGRNAGWMETFLSYVDDPFAKANLSVPVSWPWFTLLPGLLLLAAVFFAFRDLWVRRLQRGFILLFGGSMVALQLFLLFNVPRIEQYTQGPAIEFLKGIRKENPYVETLGYKSYAQYFYGNVMPVGDTASLRAYERENADRYEDIPRRDRPGLMFRDWLIHGKIDRPAYFISKMQAEKDFAQLETLEVIGRKGGFVFYKRK